MNINLLDRIYAVNPVTGRINLATVVEPPYTDNGSTLLDVMVGDSQNTIYATIDIEDVRTMKDFIVQVALEVGA